MADINISLENAIGVKHVHIEGLGDFKVRKLGAGEELDLSMKTRRLGEIMGDLTNIRLPEVDENNPKPEDTKLLNEMNDKVSKMMDEINDIKRFKLEVYSRCFDDGGTGNTKKLFDLLTEERQANLFREIFNPVQLEETKEDA